MWSYFAVFNNTLQFTQGPLPIIDLTSPTPAALVPLQTCNLEEHTLPVLGPLPAPLATICSCPPSPISTPMDKSDRPNTPTTGGDGDLVKPPAVHPPLINPVAVQHSERGSSSGVPHDKLNTCGAIVDVIPTDGSNIDATNQLPHAVKRYTERDDFYPSTTEVKTRLYADFRDMHNKRADDKRPTDILQMQPNNPVHVSLPSWILVHCISSSVMEFRSCLQCRSFFIA